MGRPEIAAWKPDVSGVVEVLHARFTDHAYPAHTHDAWTLLLVDDGAITYDLERHHHGALRPAVTVLPPHVPHDGRAATPDGFRKRVVYLDTSVLGEDLVGAAVDRPGLPDPVLRRRVHQLHGVLEHAGEELEAESRLALVADRVRAHLLRRAGEPPPRGVPGLAARLRDLLDERVRDGLALDEAAALLHAHPAHLVRAFTAEFGIPPHRYLTGRRLDAARRLLLAGQRPAEVATEVGFYDQSHLTRHFARLLGTSPARYARSR
ncbi:AraC family transcriptional regulator [Umezawaea beigongshangensis]|uniref:AraC family transcriptional regulator n=1 Tax=Umezawaea beigongshangensis TaxID=2780383 RepID=UPI0027DE62D3|nr:AraC family transcriptional regulator [Umezawaea beigongshangensis]